MKNFALIAKIVTAIAAIVGFAYIIATYGEQIIAWAKKLLNSCPCHCTADDCANCECELNCPAAEEIVEDEFDDDDDEDEDEVEEAEEAVIEIDDALTAEEDDFE